MKTHFNLKAILAACSLALMLQACGTPAPTENIVQIAGANDQVSTLVEALTAADLTSALEGEGPFTVFAPTNEAFEALPTEIREALFQPEHKEVLAAILRYHVVSSKLQASDITSAIEMGQESSTLQTLHGSPLIATLEDGAVVLKDPQGNSASVTSADLMASNGVIHLIDEVLLPEGVDPAALLSTPDIVTVAMNNEQFSTLVAAVQAANLVETLQGEGPFTVFAPVNAAFAALPEGTVESLLKPENQEQLAGILTYHVVAGKVDAKTLTNAIKSAENSTYTIPTVNGGNLAATIQDGKVILTDAQGNAATVVVTDVNASNGIIHAIDAVVMP
ncbi:MAG: fasciclin domain-containing protein [Phaeodactylibacter sp.]|uniref:fasciclin domain-containing protein n=1 Tax=Phaeodactylibacter sp. TaxID=1940289 RepID=UPI0032EF14E5